MPCAIVNEYVHILFHRECCNCLEICLFHFLYPYKLKTYLRDLVVFKAMSKRELWDVLISFVAYKRWKVLKIIDYIRMRFFQGILWAADAWKLGTRCSYVPKWALGCCWRWGARAEISVFWLPLYILNPLSCLQCWTNPSH